MDTALPYVLGFGFFPGITVLGLMVLQCTGQTLTTGLPAVARLALALAIGLLVSLPVLFITAWWDAYSPPLAGSLGWVLTALGARRHLAGLFTGWRRADRWLALGVLALAIWHGCYRTESLFAGRDEGVYSNHAVHLARTGALRATPTFGELYEGHNVALAGGLQAGGYFFDVEQGDIYFQFPPTFALTLAAAFGAGSFTGLFLLNPLLAALNAGLFFVLLQRALNARWALLGTAVFSLNLAQVWIARITLSEVLTQSWLFAGLLLLLLALQHRDRRTSLLAHGLIAACTFVRVDAYLVLIGLAGFDLWLSQAARDDHAANQERQMARHGTTLAIALGAVAFGYGFATSPGYYADFSGRLLAMWSVATMLTVLAWVPLPRAWRTTGERFLALPRLWQGLSAALILIALFAWWVRPHLQPFAEFVSSMGQSGRDYRENTVRDLAAYLSPPGLALVLVGLVLALRRVLVKRELFWALLLALWFACALLYLYNPYISVDHIWKMRRFVPVILPGMAILLALGAQGLASALPRGLPQRWLPTGMVTLVVAWIAWTLVPVGFTRLNAGAVDFVQSIKRQIPDDALVVATVRKPLLGPLQLVEKVEMVRAIPGDEVQEEVLRQVIATAQAAGRRVMLLSPDPLVANARREARAFELVHPNLLRTTEPPPRTIEPRRRTAYLSTLGPRGLGIDPTANTIRLGANRIYGVRESGFADQESVAGIPFRWTLGERATLTLPTDLAEQPERGYLDLMAVRPGGAPVILKLNGQVVFQGEVPAAGGLFPLDLARVDWTPGIAHFELLSPTFRPSDLDPDSTDHRELGVRLGGIVLVSAERPGRGRLDFGLGRTPYVQASGLHGLENVHGEPARWTDGHARFAIHLPAGAAPQRLRLPIAGISHQGADLEVRWQGQTLRQQHLTAAPQEWVLELPPIDPAQPTVLELISDTFVPDSASDDRQLGVMIHPLSLQW